jgi:hypothetical protein
MLAFTIVKNGSKFGLVNFFDLYHAMNEILLTSLETAAFFA